MLFIFATSKDDMIKFYPIRVLREEGKYLLDFIMHEAMFWLWFNISKSLFFYYRLFPPLFLSIYRLWIMFCRLVFAVFSETRNFNSIHQSTSYCTSAMTTAVGPSSSSLYYIMPIVRPFQQWCGGHRLCRRSPLHRPHSVCRNGSKKRNAPWV